MKKNNNNEKNCPISTNVNLSFHLLFRTFSYHEDYFILFSLFFLHKIIFSFQTNNNLTGSKTEVEFHYELLGNLCLCRKLMINKKKRFENFLILIYWTTNTIHIHEKIFSQCGVCVWEIWLENIIWDFCCCFVLFSIFLLHFSSFTMERFSFFSCKWCDDQMSGIFGSFNYLI